MLIHIDDHMCVNILFFLNFAWHRGDCGIFTIKNAECLLEGRDVRYWVIHDRMQMFREWMACYLWGHARRKTEGEFKSDDEVDTDF